MRRRWTNSPQVPHARESKLFFVLLEDRCRRMLQRARAVLGPALSIGSSGCRFPSVKGADLIPLADVVTSPSCQLSSMLAKFMAFLRMGKKDVLISECMVRRECNMTTHANSSVVDTYQRCLMIWEEESFLSSFARGGNLRESVTGENGILSLTFSHVKANEEEIPQGKVHETCLRQASSLACRVARKGGSKATEHI